MSLGQDTEKSHQSCDSLRREKLEKIAERFAEVAFDSWNSNEPDVIKQMYVKEGRNLLPS